MSQTIIENTYNKTDKTLSIVFGYDKEKVYTYQNVPAKIANGLENADSKGKYFHANIRPKFKFTSEYR